MRCWYPVQKEIRNVKIKRKQQNNCFLFSLIQPAVFLSDYPIFKSAKEV